MLNFKPNSHNDSSTPVDFESANFGCQNQEDGTRNINEPENIN